MSARISGRGWLVVNAALAVAVLATALSSIQASHHCRQHYARLQALEASQWQMQEQWGRLLLEQSTLAAHRVERLARKELGMHLPQADELEVVLP